MHMHCVWSRVPWYRFPTFTSCRKYTKLQAQLVIPSTAISICVHVGLPAYARCSPHGYHTHHPGTVRRSPSPFPSPFRSQAAISAHAHPATDLGHLSAVVAARQLSPRPHPPNTPRGRQAALSPPFSPAAYFCGAPPPKPTRFPYRTIYARFTASPQTWLCPAKTEGRGHGTAERQERKRCQ
jgi:hypothetical protein